MTDLESIARQALHDNGVVSEINEPMRRDIASLRPETSAADARDLRTFLWNSIDNAERDPCAQRSESDLPARETLKLNAKLVELQRLVASESIHHPRNTPGGRYLASCRLSLKTRSRQIICMSVSRASHPARDYREWRSTPVSIASRAYVVATKPGVFAHGRTDPAALLLAEHARIDPMSVVVCLNCGNGLFGAIAGSAASTGRVILADRNVVSVEAARRTLEANRVTNGEVVLGHGSIALPPGLVADVVAIRTPHERLTTLQLLWDAFRILKVGGQCYVAGATNEGIKATTLIAKELFGNAGAIAHGGGCRVVLATKTADTPTRAADLGSPFLDGNVFHERDGILRGRNLRVFSRPGVFSWDHLDEATNILAESMRIGAGDAVLDLGCGAGVLGTVAATMSGDGNVCMVDADIEAVRSTRRTAAAAGLKNVEVLSSDITEAVRDRRFDVVVTNPPFHVGKKTELSVPFQFIQEGWEVLSPGGRLYLVANRTLPYERAIHRLFGNILTLHDGQRFKVLAATR